MKTYAMTAHCFSEVPNCSHQSEGANSSFRFSVLGAEGYTSVTAQPRR